MLNEWSDRDGVDSHQSAWSIIGRWSVALVVAGGTLVFLWQLFTGLI
jgi:hypothetical protein